MTRRALPIALTVLALAASPPPARTQDSPPDAGPRLERASVPAAGEHRSVVSVPRFGRYALFTESERGVALRVVDRMAGPGEVSGEPGVEDGRVDAFLDRGDYLLETFGHPASAGDATLRAEPFRELQPEPLALVDLKPVSTELGDLEQRSWWLRVGSRQRVVIEAAGRHLEDLRLWRDGSWLVATTPTFDTVEPRPGQPLRLARLAARLEPGLYRLAAYGGPGVPWTEDDGSRPLHLRSGLPKVTEAARRRFEISPFGFDRLLVPGTATYFRVDLAGDAPAGESVDLELARWWDEQRPFGADPVQTATITKESRRPVAELEAYTSEDEKRWHVVTVRGRAGEPVVLQHFRAVDSLSFRKGGRYLLTTVSTGDPADALDASALLVQRLRRNQGTTLRVTESRAVDLGRGSEWRRRINLPALSTLHLHVKDAGRYAVRADDGQGRGGARVRVEPFFAPGAAPEGYRAPPFLDDGDVYDLAAGFYVLTLDPQRAGVFTVAVGDAAGAAGDGTADADETPNRRSMAFFGGVGLEPTDYTFFLNRRPGVRSGVILRQLPIDLDRSLPLVADDTAAVEVPARARRPGVLRATAEDGAALEVSVDGGPWQQEARVSGLFDVEVRPPAGMALPVYYDLAVIPDEWSAAVGPPPVPADALDLPDFPVLEAGAPRRSELPNRGLRTFVVRSDDAALYRLETTGLLDTEGTLRTRVNPSLASRADGGAGRNFAVQRYLGPGDYQLSVRSQGRSRGDFGVVLERSPVTDGGVLRPDVFSRAWLDAGEAVGYRFRVEEAGRYRLLSLGLSGFFSIRLEDSDGWPLLEPGVPGRQEVELGPGEYRMIVLPRDVRARQIAVVQRVPDGAPREGHGPFDLELSTEATHRWLEPGDGGERRPDRWRFRLAAAADVTVRLDDSMVAELARLDGGGGAGDQALAEVRGGGLSLELGAGEYELRARSARRDNRVDYGLEVSTEQLIAGQSRALQLPEDGSGPPARLELRVAETALVELSSLGQVDVRARLFDAGGELLAAADDRPGDWNFRLARRLDPGTYALEVEAVSAVDSAPPGGPGPGGGPGGGRVWVRMDLPEEETLDAVALGARAAALDVAPGDGAVRIPVTLPAGADVLTASFSSREHVRVAVEVAGRPVVEREGRSGSLWLPVDAGSEPLLRVDSLDQSGNPTRLDVAAVTARRADGGRVTVRESPALGGRGVVAVDFGGPGCFRVTGRAGGVESASAPGVAPTVLSGVASSTSGSLYLAAPAGASLGLERYALTADGGPTRLRLPAGGEAACDVEVDGPAVLRARGLGAPVSLRFGPGYGDQALAETTSLLLPAAPGLLYLRAGDGAELEVDVDLRPLTPSAIDAKSPPLPPGRSERAVGASGAVVLDLPAGPKRLRLSLSRGLAAELGDGRTVWAAEAGLDAVLFTDSVALRLADVDGDGGRAAVDLAAAQRPPAVGAAAALERRLPGGVRTEGRVEASADGPRTLRAPGAVATWMAADGQIRRGSDLRI
ncbi:MAG: hypothetical protein AAGF23_05115, partial [Acidobacteriota bacterium]